MSKISLKFTKKNGRFCLCARVKETGVRHYKTVEKLKNPNFSKWNPDAQMFISGTQDDNDNNIILQDFLNQIKQINEEYDCESGKELFAIYDSHEKERQETPVEDSNIFDTLFNIIAIMSKIFE